MKLLLKSWRAFGSRGVEDEYRDGVKKKRKVWDTPGMVWKRK